MRKDMDNRVELPDYIRQLLLKEFCRLDNIILTSNEYLNLDLVQVKGPNYRGTCPWCRQKDAFSMNKRSSACSCNHCGESGDYLDLMCLYREDDLSGAFTFFSLLMEDFAKIEVRWRREKRADKKRMRELTGGAV